MSSTRLPPLLCAATCALSCAFGAGPAAAAERLIGAVSVSRLIDDEGSTGDHFTVQLASGLETRVTNYNARGGIAFHTPSRLSPDGTKIAYAAPTQCTSSGCRGREIFVANADGSNAVNVTNREPEYDGAPAWSPDGETILFVRGVDGGGSDHVRELYVMNPDGSRLQRLPSRQLVEGSTTIFPSWSPDGSRIVYAFGPSTGNRHDLAVLTLETDEQGNFTVISDVQLTSTPEDETKPIWSPDGTRIAFERLLGGNEGKYEIFVMNADGSREINITNTPERGEFCPVWSPDGSRLVFTRILDPTAPNNIGGQNELVVVNADGSNPIRLGLNGYGNYAWSWVDPCRSSLAPRTGRTTPPSGRAATATSSAGRGLIAATRRSWRGSFGIRGPNLPVIAHWEMTRSSVQVRSFPKLEVQSDK